tara:strand:- start:2964 stop:3302 length:339 start_codon:yes stop_codon:yes gene_type:complete
MTASRTERPLFDGTWLIRKIESTGIPLPEGLNRDRFFIVICSTWASETEEFLYPKMDSKGVQVFKEFADATDCFHKSNYCDFVDGDLGDIEVELFQYNRGIGRVIHCKILFS